MISRYKIGICSRRTGAFHCFPESPEGPWKVPCGMTSGGTGPEGDKIMCPTPRHHQHDHHHAPVPNSTRLLPNNHTLQSQRSSPVSHAV